MEVLAVGLMAVVANAAVVGGDAGAGAGAAMPGMPVAVSGTAGAGSAIYPTPVPPPAGEPGFVQFNNLVVQSVSSGNVPSEIVATNNYPVPMGVLNSSGGAAPASATSPVQCYKFESQAGTAGTAIQCPVPPSANQKMPAMMASGSTDMPATSATQPTYIPVNPSYRIEVNAATRLSLRDRTVATLADFTQGDQVNVFGYYNADGSIQAYLVRDISKPVQTETMQLNNVKIVSISGTAIPATIAVAQEQSAPCYGYDTGSGKPIMCPLGLPSFSNNTATQNVTPPQAMAPNWVMLRKYAVTVDAQTVLLDKNRTALTLSNLKVGDTLNVYGETSDNGQTLNADIVRDLSIPPSASNYSGKITQVNADGSFVIQTDDGQTITVQGAIQTGAAVTVRGVLDSSSNTLTEVAGIYFGSSLTTPPIYLPTPAAQPMIRSK